MPSMGETASLLGVYIEIISNRAMSILSAGGAEPGANILSAKKETTTRRASILFNL